MITKKNLLIIGILITGLGILVSVGAVMQILGLFSLDSTFAQDADDVLIDADVENALPVVVGSSIHLNDGTTDDPAALTLTEESSQVLRCKVTVSDDNGCGDIDGAVPVATIFYSAASGGSACASDRRDCFTGTAGAATVSCAYDTGSCTDPTGGSDLTATYTCKAYAGATEGIRYFSAPSEATGDWECYIVPKDEAAGTGTGVLSTTQTEVNELLAFKVVGADDAYPDPYISYGLIARGDVSAQQNIKVYNTGNLAIDTNIKSYYGSMDCGVGSLTSGHANYSLSDGFEWNSDTSDSSTVYHLENSEKKLDLDEAVTSSSQDQAATINSVNTYWLLKVPTSGAAGYCADYYAFYVLENT